MICCSDGDQRWDESGLVYSKKDGSAALIFVTAMENRAVEDYAVDALDYIVKSNMKERLDSTLKGFGIKD